MSTHLNTGISEALGRQHDNRKARQWAEVLATVPLFNGLSDRHLRKIAEQATMKRYAPSATMVRTGDAGDAFYVILDGTANVRRAGKRTIKLRPGDFFGELALLDPAPRVATVQAETEVLAMRLGRTGFQRVLDKEPKVAVSMLRTLAARMRTSEESG
jgi:CRP-like cAMP-binding protein